MHVKVWPINLHQCRFTPSIFNVSLRKQVLATKAEAERDGVKVPTTLAEYCVRTRAPPPDEGSDLFYDYYYDDDDVEDGDGDCCYDEDDSGNEESWHAFSQHAQSSWYILHPLLLRGLSKILGLQPRSIWHVQFVNQWKEQIFLKLPNSHQKLKLTHCCGGVW